MDDVTGTMVMIGGLSAFVADDGSGVWINGQLLTRSEANRLADLLTRATKAYQIGVGRHNP